jgi:hypothetical protein
MDTIQPYFHSIHPYINDSWNFLHQGFNNVNAVKGLIIALIAAIMLENWKRLWGVALGATLMDVIISAMTPVLAHQAEFRMPPLTGMPFWRHVLALYLGYLIVIGVFFFVRTSFMRGGGGKKAAKHG